MRYVNLLLGLLMIAFAVLQYNDPDVLLWMVIYLVPAGWAFAAAFRLARVRSRTGTALLWLSVLAGIGTTAYYWPATPGFWRREVWWMEETAREGMGVMVALAVLITVLVTALRKPAADRS